MGLQFADDSALLTETQESAEAAIQNFASIAASYGLTVNHEKTKLMTCGPKLCVEDAEDIDIGIPGRSVQHVKQFKYLGSIVSDDLSLDLDITERIAQAGKCFGALKEAVFQSPHVTPETKNVLFQSTVLSVLLYGSSSWAVTRRDITRLVTFTNQCQRFMLGIDKFKQKLERITSNDIRHKLGNLETAEDSLMAQRLRWLGHLERMEDHRLPK